MVRDSLLLINARTFQSYLGPTKERLFAEELTGDFDSNCSTDELN
jgi:hypothetical protein